MSLLAFFFLNNKYPLDETKALTYRDDVKTSVGECALGVVNVTETAVDLTGNVSDIGDEADSNLKIVDQLNGEVGKFKL